MEKNQIINMLYVYGIIPVIKLEKIENAQKLADALVTGGIPLAEVTFRADGAEKVIYKMKERYPEMLIAAGTVLNTKHVDLALSAGADFIVSPGFNDHVIYHCLKKEKFIVPGCVTPSEIEQALSFSLHTVKFFPSEAMGGIEAIKALNGPYNSVRFMPTGGINQHNLIKYPSLENVLACAGTFMVPSDQIKAERWQDIIDTCRNVQKLIRSIADKRKVNEEVWEMKERL